MSEISTRLIQGLLIGVGIVIAVVGLMGLFWVFWMLPDDDGYENWKEYSAKSKLVISDSRKIVRNNELVILGALKNEGEDSWYDISVEVEIFDASGVFLDECSYTIEDIVKPNTSENFKMICSSCKDIDPKLINSHTARIMSADYYIEDE